MLWNFFILGSVFAFVLAILGLFKVVPFANILAGIMLVTIACLVGSQGLDVPTGTHITDSSAEIVYTTYSLSDPFVFAFFWFYLGLGIFLILKTFVY